MRDCCNVLMLENFNGSEKHSPDELMAAPGQ